MNHTNYEWVDEWVTIPDSPMGRTNGITHGVAVSATGYVFVFHQASPSVLVFNSDGQLLDAWGDFPGAHGMSLVIQEGKEFLWLTDQDSARVVKTTLDGKTMMELPSPDHVLYSQDNKYIPTWASQHPDTGEVWVADGYGAYLVHRYDSHGNYQSSIDGSEGAGRFCEPHGLAFTRGSDGVELFITDRSNHRIAVYDDQGNFLRSSLSAHSPCSFDFLNNQVVVPELFTGVKLLEKNNLELITEIGANELVGPRPDGGWWPPAAPEGWPNLAGTPLIRPGRFNSPHAACFAPNGDIYVVEWIIGGRITKLVRK